MPSRKFLTAALAATVASAAFAAATANLAKLLESASVSPGRIAETVSGETRPAIGALPAHLRFAFDEDKLSDGVVYRERQVLFIPVADYRKQMRGNARRIFDLRLQLLKQVIYGGIGENVREIPVFPFPAEPQSFHAAVGNIVFKGGAGVRFITRFGPEESVTSNDNIFYVFEGLSKDGKTLVSFFHPISIRNLPVTQDGSLAGMYMDQQEPDRFSPSLTKLDQVAQSIQLNP